MTASAQERARIAREGMYRPDMESDACGVGLVAATDGKPNRRVVQSAIDALKAVWHRRDGRWRCRPACRFADCVL